MPNVLPFEKRVTIISALTEGNSIRGTSRLLNVDKDTVMYLGASIGMACMAMHDRMVRNIRAPLIEVDEIHAYVGKHQNCKLPTDPTQFGDAYTMFAIDPVSKLVVSYLTCRRTLLSATRFMGDLRTRVSGKPQMSVDGWPSWPDAVRRAFGPTGVDLGVSLKEYRSGFDQEATCARSRIKSMSHKVVLGDPLKDFISTAIAERVNLTARMHQRRLTRQTSGYSKKRAHLRAAMGLHFFWYNFVRVHETLRTTPAVKAGIASAPWTISQLVRQSLDVAGL